MERRLKPRIVVRLLGAPGMLGGECVWLGTSKDGSRGASSQASGRDVAEKKVQRLITTITTTIAILPPG